MPGRLVLVRHGDTGWSRSGRHTGRTDVALDPEGRRQARRLATRLGGHRFADVLVSPALRARETCAGAGFGAEARVVEDLHEWDYGDFEGRTTPEIQTQWPGWSLWHDGAPGGETPAQVAARADRVLALAARHAAAGDVLLFAHGHLLRVVAARWIGLDGASGARLALDPASISILGHERDTAVLERWNDTDEPL
ncbi:MAG TPA: histidine phosphatase family protein [Acidimicrobiales bacterium]|nr:histidine phosphatase family protein [Acidimicrobiales bacterium]